MFPQAVARPPVGLTRSQSVSLHSHEISDCYGRALTEKGSEHLKGKLVVNFNIDETGKSKDYQVVPRETTLNNQKLNNCLFAKMDNWSFPVHPDRVAVNVTYPFVFRANPPANMQKKMDQFEKLRE